MKNISTAYLMLFSFLISIGLNAQVGIGTTEPDASSVLDVFSNSKGLLMPRLSTSQRDAMTLPATGLMIYNQTLNDGELNVGTPLAPIWEGIKGSEAAMIYSISEGESTSTSSTTDLLVSGMTLSPPTGNYMVLFNAQMLNKIFSTEEGIIDVDRIKNILMSIPSTDNSHAPVFGNGEILTPGVYEMAGATSLAGTLTLDGGGDSDSVFIIRSAGAFTVGAATSVVLINGASSNNIFWVASGAMSIGANCLMKGTLVASTGAITMGADSTLEGRMFSTTGAISMGPGIINFPAGTSYIDLGILSTFVIFSSNGAISNAGVSTINGDVGTGSGAVTGFDNTNGDVYPAGSTSEYNVTYSIYQNGLEVVNSSRTIVGTNSIVSLQTMVDITTGQPIEIRWKVDTSQATLEHRILSLFRSGN